MGDTQRSDLKGIEPEIIPSTFDEMLPQDEFENVYEYPVATATQKAVEVYERLVVRFLPFFSSSPAYMRRSVVLKS